MFPRFISIGAVLSKAHTNASRTTLRYLVRASVIDCSIDCYTMLIKPWVPATPETASTRQQEAARRKGEQEGVCVPMFMYISEAIFKPSYKMVHLFGSVRDQWIASDLQGWLAPNRIYDGVAQAVAASQQADEVHIVTTKQAHYTEILMRDMAKVPIPPERIVSQTISGRPKTEVLHRLADEHPQCSGHLFVEDKLSTLEKVCADPGLSHWQLYLVDWGYNTPKERQRAADNPRIDVISVQQFQRLLQNHV